MEANDSLECRNCHSAVAMDFTKQTNRAAAIHAKYLISKQRTCIDCHKDIAHELPDMTGVEPGWSAPPEETDRRSSLEDFRHYAKAIQMQDAQLTATGATEP